MTEKMDRRQAIDPETCHLLRDLKERDDHRSLSAGERKERKKAKDRLPRRVNWDLPVELKRRIKALAEEEGVPESQVAAWLLMHGLESAQEKKGSFHEALRSSKVPSRSPRYGWNLCLEWGGGGER